MEVTVPDKWKEVDITIVTGDNKSLQIKAKILVYSKYLGGFIEDFFKEDPPGTLRPINLLNIEGKEMIKIKEYMEYHWNNRPDEIERPLRGELSDALSDWDYTFIKGKGMNQSMILKIIRACNFINLEDLLYLASARFADSLRNKSPNEIRDIFGIAGSDKFSPEERIKIRERNKCVSIKEQI